MHRRLWAAAAGLVTMISCLTPIKALDKSIQILNPQQQVSNAGPALTVDYQGVKALVFYGASGIEIIGDGLQKHIDTNFDVAKLAAVKDVNGDGLVDFLAYELASDYADQLFVLSGADGSVLASRHLARASYDNALGQVETNATVRLLADAGDGTGLVVYDYTVMSMTLASGEVRFSYTAEDNIWDATAVSDIDGDGQVDYAVTIQTGAVRIISGTDGKVLQQYQLAPALSLSFEYLKKPIPAQLCMWDVEWLGGLLYATSEAGHLFSIDLASRQYDDIDLGLVSSDELTSWASNQMAYYDGAQRYAPTGLNTAQFFGYRIADTDDRYLLIDCYMGDADQTQANASGEMPTALVVYDRTAKAVTATIRLTEAKPGLFMKACLGQYQGADCLAVVTASTAGSQHWVIYDMAGTAVLQKDVAVAIAQDSQMIAVSWRDDGYMAEVYDAGCYTLGADLKAPAYLYSNTSALLLQALDGGAIVKYTNNGSIVGLARLGSDLQTVVWKFDVPTSYVNKGFEFVSTAVDYDGDGTDDVLGIIDSYDKDGAPVASYFIIISGKDGAVIRNAAVVTGTYVGTDKKKHNTYLMADKLSALRDIDGDGRKELAAGDAIVGSRKNKVIGQWGGQPYVDGTLIAVGDANGDGLDDYLAVTSKEARLYTSKLTYSYGYAMVEFKKTGTAIATVKANDPANTTTAFGDINGDGVKEVVFVDRNAAGSQTYRVVDGKTLTTMFHLMADGVTDSGEQFMVLPDDINGDGRREIYAIMSWGVPTLLSGADGSVLMQFGDGKNGPIIGKYGTVTSSPASTDAVVKEANPKLDYIVPFTVYQGAVNFVIGGDYNKDGLKDLTVLTTVTNQQTWAMETSLCVYDAKTMALLAQMPLGTNDYALQSATLHGVSGSASYSLLTGDSSTRLLDTATNETIAIFNKAFTQAFYIDGQYMLAALTDGTLYKLSYQKSFTASYICGTAHGSLDPNAALQVDDHLLNIAWKPLQDYSVMTVTDNGTKVYQGAAESCVVPLVEGRHTIVLTMADGQGKSSTTAFTVELSRQTSPLGWIVLGLGAVALAAAVYFSVSRKLTIRRKAGIRPDELKRARRQDKQAKKTKKKNDEGQDAGQPAPQGKEAA